MVKAAAALNPRVYSYQLDLSKARQKVANTTKKEGSWTRQCGSDG